MLRRSILSLVGAAGACLFGIGAVRAEGPYDGYRIVVIDVKSQKDFFVASQIGRPLACLPGPGPNEFLVAPEAMVVLTESGIPFVVTIENTQAFIDEESEINARARAERGAEFFDAYRTITEINDFLTELDALPGPHADTVTRFPIGQSIEGRTVYALRVSTPPTPDQPPKPTFLITSGQHAREWIGVSSGLFIADRLVRGYGNNPAITSLVDSIDFVFVPVVNPDGYRHTFPVSQGGGGDRYWRKNRRINVGSIGVDTNRNWGYQWGGAGASTLASSDTYRGTGPFSEPETQNVRNLVEGLAGLPGLPNLKAMVDLHTYSELVLSPWGYSSSPPPRSDEFDPLTSAQVTAMNMVDNQSFIGGPASTTLYFASGIAPDWGLGARNALSWTYELRPLGPGGLGGFSIPASQIGVAGEEAFAGISVIAQHLLHRLQIQVVSVTNPLPLIGGGSITVQINPLNAYALDTASPRLFWRNGDSGPFAETVMTPTAQAGRYTASLISPPCGESLRYFIRAQTTDGGVTTFPGDAPANAAPVAGAACPDCLGDADGNRTLDFVDISAILTNWGATGPAGPPSTIGDANYDGVVNFEDISTVIARWGVVCP